jgi:F0F1-type ATP synthase assembly protein I
MPAIPPDALNTFSRTLASAGLILLFGVIGYYLDQWLGTSFFVVLGVIVGTILFIAVMIIRSKLENQQRKDRKLE